MGTRLHHCGMFLHLGISFFDAHYCSFSGIPYHIRCDLGVENFTADQMLNYLCQDIRATFMGTSTSNQVVTNLILPITQCPSKNGHMQ